jgi:hypothetical protein
MGLRVIAVVAAFLLGAAFRVDARPAEPPKAPTASEPAEEPLTDQGPGQ